MTAIAAKKPLVWSGLARGIRGNAKGSMDRFRYKTFEESYRSDFIPQGSADILMKSQASEILFAGPAGTGKSRSCLEKIHRCALKYPGMRALVVRKSRSSTVESTLFTYEEKVLPEKSRIKFGPKRFTRQKYIYPNGSEVVVSGMDYATKIMSTEYDLIYANECVELEEDDWEALLTRLRNGKMPYQQIIGDTNPAGPTHWAKRRSDNNKMLYIPASHKDNPVLWDGEDWTPEGIRYLGILSNLTGVRKERYLEGKWAGAEGMIHPEYNSFKNVCNPFSVPASWHRYWGVDFGFQDPFVWSCYALSPSGVLYRTKEIYLTQTHLEDIIPLIVAATIDEPMPEKIVCDHDADGRATMEAAFGMRVTPARKSIITGLQAVSRRLSPDENDRPGLMFFRNSLQVVDQVLLNRRMPVCTEEEFDSYIYKSGTELPVDKNDHGMNTLRYVVSEVDNIESEYSSTVRQYPAYGNTMGQRYTPSMRRKISVIY